LNAELYATGLGGGGGVNLNLMHGNMIYTIGRFSSSEGNVDPGTDHYKPSYRSVGSWELLVNRELLGYPHRVLVSCSAGLSYFTCTEHRKTTATDPLNLEAEYTSRTNWTVGVPIYLRFSFPTRRFVGVNVVFMAQLNSEFPMLGMGAGIRFGKAFRLVE
jgi:hypothetical protein